MRRDHPDKEIEVWAEDEARLGLQPVIRRIWAPKGKRPIAVSNRKFQWLYAYCFVRPDDGKNYWMILPTVSVEAVNLALKEFVQAINPEGNKKIVLLWDQAGFYKGKELEVPESIEGLFLPAYSPELYQIYLISIP